MSEQLVWANEEAWEMFLLSFSRHEIEVEKGKKRDLFDIDWNLLGLMMRDLEVETRHDNLRKIVVLLRELNRK